jgi:hypothetical protein
MPQHHSRSAKHRDFGLVHAHAMDKRAACHFWLEGCHGSVANVPCPECGETGPHRERFFRQQLRCKNIACARDFSIFFGTILDNTKWAVEFVIVALVLFCAAAHGISAGELARVLCVNYKTAFTFLGRLREAIIREHERPLLQGEVEIDGGHFGGKPRKPCRKRKPTAKGVGIRARHKYGSGRGKHHPQMPQTENDQLNALKRMDRRIAIVMRECNGGRGSGGGRSVVAICLTENGKDVEELVRRFVRPGSIVRTDENKAYDWLSAKSSGYVHERVNHSEAFATVDGINENQAESFFSRLRRGEYGTLHRVTPRYFADYAWEHIWRENVRKLSARERVVSLIKLVRKAGMSHWWRNYYQGNRRKKEILMDRLP